MWLQLICFKALFIRFLLEKKYEIKVEIIASELAVIQSHNSIQNTLGAEQKELKTVV